MNQDIKNHYIILAISAVLSAYSFLLVYKLDKLTATLLVLILLTKSIIDIMNLKNMYKEDANLKIAIVNAKYRKIAYIVYIASALLYITPVFYFTPTIMALATVSFFYANLMYFNNTIVRYSSNFFIYNNKIARLNEIKKIDVVESKYRIDVTNFNNRIKSFKFSSSEDLKLVERILRRK